MYILLGAESCKRFEVLNFSMFGLFKFQSSDMKSTQHQIVFLKSYNFFLMISIYTYKDIEFCIHYAFLNDENVSYNFIFQISKAKPRSISIQSRFLQRVPLLNSILSIMQVGITNIFVPDFDKFLKMFVVQQSKKKYQNAPDTYIFLSSSFAIGRTTDFFCRQPVQ